MKRCRNERLKLIRERLEQVLVEAKQSRLDGEQLRAIIESALAELDRQG